MIYRQVLNMISVHQLLACMSKQYVKHGKCSATNYYQVSKKKIFTNSNVISLLCRSRDDPTIVTSLSGRQVVHIASGGTYSAAITANGELYTWGRGNYGRLGHGNSEDVTSPTIVCALKGHRVIDIACGSGDSQTLAVTDTGLHELIIFKIYELNPTYSSTF